SIGLASLMDLDELGPGRVVDLPAGLEPKAALKHLDRGSPIDPRGAWATEHAEVEQTLVEALVGLDGGELAQAQVDDLLVVGEGQDPVLGLRRDRHLEHTVVVRLALGGLPAVDDQAKAELGPG